MDHVAEHVFAVVTLFQSDMSALTARFPMAPAKFQSEADNLLHQHEENMLNRLLQWRIDPSRASAPFRFFATSAKTLVEIAAGSNERAVRLAIAELQNSAIAEGKEFIRAQLVQPLSDIAAQEARHDRLLDLAGIRRVRAALRLAGKDLPRRAVLAGFDAVKTHPGAYFLGTPSSPHHQQGVIDAVAQELATFARLSVSDIERRCAQLLLTNVKVCHATIAACNWHASLPAT